MMKSPYFEMQESIIRRWRKIATLGRLCKERPALVSVVRFVPAGSAEYRDLSAPWAGCHHTTARVIPKIPA